MLRNIQITLKIMETEGGLGRKLKDKETRPLLFYKQTLNDINTRKKGLVLKLLTSEKDFI